MAPKSTDAPSTPGKRNKQREVPLNATVREVLTVYLDSLPAGTEYLFPSEKTGKRLMERALRHLIQKYMRLAGLEGFSAHDLRHRFGYVMAEKIPLHRLAQMILYVQVKKEENP
jgi:integrase/recombinase XerD